MQLIKSRLLLLTVLFSFSLISCYNGVVSSSDLSSNEDVPSDRVSWWQSKNDDASLRKRFEELNKQYFDGELKVKYIRYGHGLIDEGITAVTYYWNKQSSPDYAGCSVITVDDRFFVKYPCELDGMLLHEMCHVYANMHDPDAEIPGIDGHTLPSYKKKMKELKEMGAHPRTGEGIAQLY